uniref:HAP1 N-terminal domain-containing protein n=1 Tax=Macrostomum lignano TaxID=282301 RepID=A0A1I8HR77_9PLAT
MTTAQASDDYVQIGASGESEFESQQSHGESSLAQPSIEDPADNGKVGAADNGDDDICDDAIAVAAAAASSADGVGSQELGNYLQSYMGRRAAAAEATEPGSLNVYEELRQKEQDLLLAAELGRALLCSNAQLKEEAELLRAEFEARLAASEREKADLRGKMDAAEQDWDAQLRDLQAETRALREELRRQQVARSELLAANERLLEDCRQSAARVESLQSELRARRAEAQDRLAAVSAEVDELRAERADMERRLGRAGAELDALAAVGEEQRARLEARLAELTDTAADLRERLAASLASQRRQQMELAEEQLYQQQQQQQQQQSMITSPSTPSSSSHLLFLFGFDSGLAGDCLGESLFSELAGFGASAARMDGLYDEDIEEDEADAPVCCVGGGASGFWRSGD